MPLPPIIRRTAKAAVTLSLLVIVLAAMLASYVQMGRMNGRVKSWLESSLASALELPVHLDGVEGGPLTHLTLVGLRIGGENGISLSVRRVAARYRLLSLLTGKLQIDRVEITDPVLTLSEGKGSPPSIPSVAGPGEEAAAFPHEMRISELTLVGGKVVVAASEGRAPYELSGLDLSAGLSLVEGDISLSLRRLRTRVFSPPLAVREMVAHARSASDTVWVDELSLRTPGSSLAASGWYSGGARPALGINLRSDSLDVAEVAELAGLPIGVGTQSLRMSISGPVSNLQVESRCSGSRGDLSVQGNVGLGDRDAVYDLGFTGTRIVSGVEGGLLAGAVFDLDGRIEGKGISPGLVDLDLSARLSQLSIPSVPLDSLSVVCRIEDARVEMNLFAAGGLGRASARIEGVALGPNPALDLTADLEGVDLSLLGDLVPLETDLNGRVRLNYRQGNETTLSLRMPVVRIADRLIREADADLHLAGGRFRLEGFSGRLPSGMGRIRGTASGTLGDLWPGGTGEPTYRAALSVEGVEPDALTGVSGLGDPLDLKLDLEGTGLGLSQCSRSIELTATGDRIAGQSLDTCYASATQVDSLITIHRAALRAGTLSIGGSGTASLSGALDVHLDGTATDPSSISGHFGVDLQGDTVSVSADIAGVWSHPTVQLAARSDRVRYAEFPARAVEIRARWPVLDSGGLSVRVDSLAWGTRTVTGLFLDAGLDGSSIVFLAGNNPQDQDRIHCWGRVEPLQLGYRVVLDTLSVEVSSASIQSARPCTLVVDDKGLSSAAFELHGPAASAIAETRRGVSDTVMIRLADVDLRVWSFVLGLKEEVFGELSGEVRVARDDAATHADAHISVRKGAFGSVRFDSLGGRLDYQGDRLALDISVAQGPRGRARMKGSLPLQRSGLPGVPPEPMSLAVNCQSLDLSIIQKFTPVLANTKGFLDADLTIRGGFDKPALDGWLRVADGSATLIPLGQDFDRINCALRFGPEVIHLEALSAGGDRLLASGSAALEGYVVRGLNFQLKARDLSTVNLPDIRATVNADLNVSGPPDALLVEGQATLIRAEVQLLSFVEAPIEAESFWESSTYLKGLRGRVRLSAERNVWARGPTFDIEMEGDVDLVKDAEGIRIYGPLNSRRGIYEFAKTDFRIERGELQFLGALDINPNLYILGTHRLRLITGESAVITAVIGGTLAAPLVTLESDPDLPEVDIFSYLIIGMPAQDMTSLLGGSQSGGLESQAAGLVLGVAASQLKRSIGRELNLDIVEFETRTDDQPARVRVGKYLGSKLFVTYSQELASSGGQEVTVEYEVLPTITVEAQQRAGSNHQRDRQSVGLFWKLEW
jgi:hypothetical protein